MKRFFKTLKGKIILFIMCIVFICTSVISISGIVYMANEGYYIYNKDNICNSMCDDFIENYANGIVFSKHMPTSSKAMSFVPEGNIRYVLENGINEVIDSSPDFDKLHNSYNYRKWQYKFYYYITIDGYYATDIWRVSSTENYNWRECNTLYIDLTNYLTSDNLLTFSFKLIEFMYSIRYIIFIVLILSVILFIICFITLLKVAGKKSDTDDITPSSLDNFPYDVLLLISFIFYSALFGIVDSISYSLGLSLTTVMMSIITLFAVITGIGLCINLSVRIKTKTLLKKMFLYRIYMILRKLFDLCKKFVLKIPFIWRTVSILTALSICEFTGILLCEYEPDILLLLWFIEKLLLTPVILLIALALHKLQNGGIALANGELSHHTDTSKMFFDFKKHGENLNSIANGMSIAVNDKIKNERMKTELITNVSHDLKTPLTSIVNYATLISNEKCENSKITEYSEVLVRQSARLKRLIEDLVEASKASTGNLEITPVPCDATVFITQAEGEYDEKLRLSNLTLITKQPDEPVMIMADSQKMWRVFDNLMNNICKYALPGTRVYLSLETDGNYSVITFKNISKEEMNISTDELMERFVRGDSSRNTEGNGLGLSIAKSITELHNGTFNISVDGDLFKAVITIPLTDVSS